MTNSEYEFDGPDWEGQGYWGCLKPNSLHFDQDQWKQWAIALEQAKQGIFEPVTSVLNIVWTTFDSVLEHIGYELIGDAGPDKVFEPMVDYIQTADRWPGRSGSCSNALWIRGRLADLPLMLSVYGEDPDNTDISNVSSCISNLIGPTVAPNPQEVYANMSEYRKITMAAYDKAVDRWGGDQVLLYEGELLSVAFLARQILKDLQVPTYFRHTLRRRFESITGIDCTAFYEDEEIQPLEAAAIVETFLDSDYPDHFEPGVRYFFGHRIP